MGAAPPDKASWEIALRRPGQKRLQTISSARRKLPPRGELCWCQLEQMHNRAFAASLIADAGVRRTGVGKDQGRFNYLEEMSDAMAKFMPKVFRAEGGATERLPRALPELMKLCNVGHLRVWANLEGQQLEKIQFLPEGLFAPNEDLTYQGTDAPNFVRSN